MRPRPTARRRSTSRSGIILLILGLVHAPWPRPDFHNIRHQDGPGEVCEHHHHLNRWHPGAGYARNVALLHWHWFAPSGLPLESEAPAPGPIVRSGAVDLDAMPTAVAPTPAWSTVLRPQANGPAPDAGPGLELASTTWPAVVLRLGTGPPRPRAFAATFAPRIPSASLLQRWTC